MIRIDRLSIRLPACLGDNSREFADHFARELARAPMQGSEYRDSLQVRLSAPVSHDVQQAARAAALRVRQSIVSKEVDSDG